jgi:hypothetical protein
MAQSGTILGSSKKKDMPSHSQQRKLWVPYPPKSMLSHHFAWKGLSKKNTAISVRMPAYIGHHWSRRGMCDVTKCRRMAFFWRTQYGKICSSSAPLQGTLGMFDARVNPWNLLKRVSNISITLIDDPQKCADFTWISMYVYIYVCIIEREKMYIYIISMSHTYIHICICYTYSRYRYRCRA